MGLMLTHLHRLAERLSPSDPTTQDFLDGSARVQEMDKATGSKQRLLAPQQTLRQSSGSIQQGARRIRHIRRDSGSTWIRRQPVSARR